MAGGAHLQPESGVEPAALGASLGGLKQSLRGDSEWLYPPDDDLRRSMEIHEPSAIPNAAHNGARAGRRQSANALLQPVLESEPDEANREPGACM